jgi:hypothetical protein
LSGALFHRGKNQRRSHSAGPLVFWTLLDQDSCCAWSIGHRGLEATVVHRATAQNVLWGAARRRDVQATARFLTSSHEWAGGFAERWPERLVFGNCAGTKLAKPPPDVIPAGVHLGRREAEWRKTQDRNEPPKKLRLWDNWLVHDAASAPAILPPHICRWSHLRTLKSARTRLPAPREQSLCRQPCGGAYSSKAVWSILLTLLARSLPGFADQIGCLAHNGLSNTRKERFHDRRIGGQADCRAIMGPNRFQPSTSKATC